MPNENSHDSRGLCLNSVLVSVRRSSTRATRQYCQSPNDFLLSVTNYLRSPNWQSPNHFLLSVTNYLQSPDDFPNWMSLLSPSRASRTIPEPCRSFLTRSFRLSFQQSGVLYLRFAAPSLPSRSKARSMILARVRSFMSIERPDVTTLTFTSDQDDSRPLLLVDLFMFLLLGSPPTCRAILQYCSFVCVFAFTNPQDDTCACPIILMSIKRVDVSALAFTNQQDGFRALSLVSYAVFPLELSPAGSTILERCRLVFAFDPQPAE